MGFTFSCLQSVDLSPGLHGKDRKMNLHTCWQKIHTIRQIKQEYASRKAIEVKRNV